MIHFTYKGTETIPEDTTALECDCCGLTSLSILPALPSRLKILWCNDNQLTSLPTLPESLEALCCQNNYLTSLPHLPASLRTLSCYNNRLTSLPKLSQGLKELNCWNNRLTSLPEDLPETLQKLMCHGNPLPLIGSTNIIEVIRQLKEKDKKIKELEEQLKIVPGGELYLQAKADYENRTSGFS